MASSLDPIVTLSLVVGTIAALIFAGVLVALAAFTIRYRDRGSGTPPQIHGHQALEVAWTAVPVLALAIVFASTPPAMMRREARCVRSGPIAAPVTCPCTT